MTKEDNKKNSNQENNMRGQAKHDGSLPGDGGPSATLAPTEKPKNFKKTIRNLFAYMGAYKYAIFFVVLISAVATIFETLGPKVMGEATTLLAEGAKNRINGSGGIDFVGIRRILIITLILYVSGAVAQFIQSLIMTNVTQKIVYKMRREISLKINKMPVSYFERVQTGDILSRITNDVDTLGQSLSQSISNFIWSIVSLIGIVVVMLTINVTMTVVAILVVPVSTLLMMLFIKFSQKHFKMQQQYLGKIDSQIEENFSGHIIIKAFNREDASIEEFSKLNDTLEESAWKSQFLSGLMRPVMRVVSDLGYAGVVISGGILCARGVVGVGAIQAFVQYVKHIGQPVQEIATIMNQFQSMAAAAERIFDFFDEEEEKEDSEVCISTENIKGDVVFDHVSFGYEPDNIIIKDFNAVIRQGQKIAIVGPTGAGKTTIVKLLMRFYDVNSGSIKVDGHDVREYHRGEYRKNYAMVLQDTWLFKGSIKDNIQYGNENADDEDIIRAAKAAKVHHFIMTLPGGYDMQLNEDATNISEGQRQLITIARAILADKKLLILDEATSSVDTRTEEEIQKAMDNLMENRTSFVIAHRLSTIKDADLILVIDKGNIVEQGTHEELISKNGFYSDLYKSQFEHIA